MGNAVCQRSLVVLQRVRVMVVESCFQASREVHERYDLKGSWVGRGGKMLKSRGDVLKD